MTAALILSPEQQFSDANGKPYAGGSLYTYVPGTTTPQQCWQDSAQTALQTNPVTLDSAGRCILYGIGSYRFLLKDALGNIVFDQPATATPFVSAAMGPIASAATIAAAQTLLGGPAFVATIAALTAATAATLTASTVAVGGYWAPGDGAGGWFVRGASATANGGTIINDASGRSWYRASDGNEINLAWFGAKGDLSSDTSPILLAALTAAAGRTIYVPVGQYRCNSLVTYAGIANIRGDGHGCGPGPAAISNSNCTQFLLYNSTASLFSITTNYRCTFKDFQINVAAANRPATGGAGISISGPAGSTNNKSLFEGLGFTQGYNNIYMQRTNQPTTKDCYFDSWVNSAISAYTTAGIEGSGGDISGNLFFGPASSTGSQGPAIFCTVGYADIHDNLFTGGAGAVDIAVASFPAGAPNIHDNVIEDYRLYGVNVSSADGSACSMCRIHDNEFSCVAFGANNIAAIVVNDYGAAWLSDLSIRGNVIRSIQGPTSTFINVSSGSGVIVADNTCDNLGASVTSAIQVTGTFVTGVPLVQDNMILGAYAAPYVLKNLAVLRDLTTGLTVAQLGGWNNGSEVLCTNGHYTSSSNFNITAGAASGGTAWRMGAAWLTIQA